MMDVRCNRRQLTPVDNPHDVVSETRYLSSREKKKTPILSPSVNRSSLVRALEYKTNREINLVVRRTLC